MTTPDLEALAADLRALQSLQQSRGWSIVEEAVRTDIVNAAMSLADNPVMSEKEMDFRRGAIAAARNFLNVLPALVQRAENDFVMASAQAEASQPNGLHATA